MQDLVGAGFRQHLDQDLDETEGHQGADTGPQHRHHSLGFPPCAPPPGKDQCGQDQQPNADWWQHALEVGRHGAVAPGRAPGKPVHIQVPAIVHDESPPPSSQNANSRRAQVRVFSLRANGTSGFGRACLLLHEAPQSLDGSPLSRLRSYRDPHHPAPVQQRRSEVGEARCVHGLAPGQSVAVEVVAIEVGGRVPKAEGL